MIFSTFGRIDNFLAMIPGGYLMGITRKKIDEKIF
jgi:hypothetical protein